MVLGQKIRLNIVLQVGSWFFDPKCHSQAIWKAKTCENSCLSSQLVWVFSIFWTLDMLGPMEQARDGMELGKMTEWKAQRCVFIILYRGLESNHFISGALVSVSVWFPGQGTTSMPCKTRPKTVCFPSSQGHGTVVTSACLVALFGFSRYLSMLILLSSLLIFASRHWKQKLK